MLVIFKTHFTGRDVIAKYFTSLARVVKSGSVDRRVLVIGFVGVTLGTLVHFSSLWSPIMIP
jgi:hypothetical protein